MVSPTGYIPLSENQSEDDSYNYDRNNVEKDARVQYCRANESLQYCIKMQVQYCSFVRCDIAVLSCRNIAVLSWCNITVLSLCNVAVMPWCNIAVMSWCNIAVLFWCNIAGLSWCNMQYSKYSVVENRNCYALGVNKRCNCVTDSGRLESSPPWKRLFERESAVRSWYYCLWEDRPLTDNTHGLTGLTQNAEP